MVIHTCSKGPNCNILHPEKKQITFLKIYVSKLQMAVLTQNVMFIPDIKLEESRGLSAVP